MGTAVDLPAGRLHLLEKDSEQAPLVSVIIPTRNRPAMLRQAIASVMAIPQNGFSLEVIVVDDSPSAETLAAATAFPEIVYLTGGNMGASAARNMGIQAARGDFISFLDDDDIWTPENIAPQLRLFREHPNWAAIYSRFCNVDGNLGAKSIAYPTSPLRQDRM